MPARFPDDLPVTPELARSHKLTASEYATVLQALGRTPSYTELGVFSVMWSEHCSYKSSRVHLRRLPTKGPRVIQGPGENAGVVDIGDGFAAVFKMESHNHPSFIEPTQGAATGVGGILRDVFTMGARPIASLDLAALRPSSITPRTAELLRGVVAGVGGYGNCVGVPTVGGELQFDARYDGNVLVNAFTCGVARADRIFYGRASGVGNSILYIGAKTGRDGIHGATMASDAFSAGGPSQRPTMQVGDPFMGKLLLEACLELFAADVLEGIQDMGRGGAHVVERRDGGAREERRRDRSRRGAAARAGDDAVRDPALRVAGADAPRRQAGQGSARARRVRALGARCGRHREGDRHGAVGRDSDARLRPARRPAVQASARRRVRRADWRAHRRRAGVRPSARAAARDARQHGGPGDAAARRGRLRPLRESCSTSWAARTSWVARVGVAAVRPDRARRWTIVRPGSDAGVVRVPCEKDGTTIEKLLAFAVDCNGRMCELDPYAGGAMAVAEVCRNLACTGAEPIGLTDCLNFGNPERPEGMEQLARAIAGVAAACSALEVPIVSGNVSLYNETDGRGILPTPTLAGVGLVRAVDDVVPSAFCRAGEGVWLLGDPLAGGAALGGSEWLVLKLGALRGPAPSIDLAAEARLQRLLLALARAHVLSSAHDVSDGGLAAALAECCTIGKHDVGASVKVALPASATAGDAVGALFGEAPTRVVVSAAEAAEAQLVERARAAGVPIARIGTTGGTTLAIAIAPLAAFTVATSEVRARREGCLREIVGD